MHQENTHKQHPKQQTTPAFTVEIPELDDAAIEAIAELLVGMACESEADETQETNTRR